MIIISFTSWPKRIENVSPVLESLLCQKVKADKIEINLSILEFPNMENDLPVDLQKLIKANDCVEINWIENNTGVFKKIIPTLKKYYGQDYYLLSIDDDWIYREDYVGLMVENLLSRKGDSFCLADANVIGNRMIYKSSCFKPDFWEKITEDVIVTRIDDFYIEHYLKAKGKKMTSFRPDDVKEITKSFNPVSPNSRNEATGQYSAEDIRHAIQVINKITFETENETH